MSQAPIGVYDSGIGGLTVLKSLKKLLPKENFVYLGDTINLPYGNKTPQQIVEYSHNITKWLINSMHVKLIVSACNTSSALALENIKHSLGIEIIGTIEPLIANLKKHDKKYNIGVLATPAAVNSRIHESKLLSNNACLRVISIPCPDFVPLIEMVNHNYEEIFLKAKDYLKGFTHNNLDSLLLGCTHYPFIKNILQQLLPDDIFYIDPAEYIALETEEILRQKNLLNNQETGRIQFYCTGNEQDFSIKLSNLTDFKNQKVKKVNLHCY